MVNTDRFQYLMLPGKCRPGYAHQELYNKVYRFWKDTWTQIFKDVGSPNALVPDDFMRQDLIPVIMDGDNIVAMHFYTFFNLDSFVTTDHRYFSIFSPQSVEKLRQHGSRGLMTMEFLTVNPAYRKSTMGFSMSAVISSLGVNVLKESFADAAIAPARKDMKVDELGYNLGFVCIESDVHRGNLHCDIVALFKQDAKLYPDVKVQGLAERLWTTRQDLRIQPAKTIPVAA